MRWNTLEPPRRTISVLLALALMLNGAAAPAAMVADETPADAAQSQHLGHEGMTDMVMGDDPAGQPTTDCCQDGNMNCQCGCVGQQAGALQIVVSARAHAAGPAIAALAISRHTSNSFTTPFRPPA
jgi:hypothetical protein